MSLLMVATIFGCYRSLAFIFYFDMLDLVYTLMFCAKEAKNQNARALDIEQRGCSSLETCSGTLGVLSLKQTYRWQQRLLSLLRRFFQGSESLVTYLSCGPC